MARELAAGIAADVEQLPRPADAGTAGARRQGSLTALEVVLGGVTQRPGRLAPPRAALAASDPGVRAAPAHGWPRFGRRGGGRADG